MPRLAIVIPARYRSGRLPGKPLIRIAGVPMIERTYRQCEKAFPAEHIYVATDDGRIQAHCEAVGIKVIMTSPDCLTGTDRVAEAASSIDADIFINVQGDEPLFNPADITAFVEAAKAHPHAVLNGYGEISDEAMFKSTSMPKVVFDANERLLYMSRAGIPATKRNEFMIAWRQVCIYAFPRAALEAFAGKKEKTPLEAVEDIEILRFVEMGIPVQMVRVSSDSIPVDNPEDVALVEQALARLG
ncbi:MAG: 3-deoxy-manno-octulosonate cytidylyltransferase [Devosia sp.]|nr:3-deoxy-manno-octulosonate cytidylyltransferase [Devosia sp.]MBN9310931.1 3-deoxy-manno-octulosonate cytidylyltransferase [Devosia sp.]